MRKTANLLVVVAVVALLVAGCKPAATPTPTKAPPPTATPTKPPEPTPTAKAAPTATPSPEAYKPTIRPAKERWKIGYGDGYAGIPFTDSVTKGINEVAEQMGVEVIYCDHAADQEKTMACADNFIGMEIDGVMFANWVAGMAETLSKKYKDAGIPMVAYDGPHPDAVAFGADNYTAGFLAGEYLGEYAKSKGWDPNEVHLVMASVPAQVVLVQRIEGCRDGVKSVFDVPDANIHEIMAEQTGQALNDMTDWLTAHPQAQYVLGFGHSDQPGIEIASALETAGLLETSVAVGQGASDEALVDLRERTDETSIFKATVSYFPENYGQYLVPVIVDLIEGNPVPDEVFLGHAVIDRSNVDEYYPLEPTPAPSPEAYKPMIRAAKERWKIGYGDGYAGVPFTDSVTKGINEVAEQMGVEVIYCDHAADQEKTMACADNFIGMEIDGVMFANWVAGMAETLSKKYKDAGIPMVAYDGPHPDAVAFGADNYTAGFLAGEYLGEYAKSKGWDPNEVHLVMASVPAQVVLVQRIEGCRDGVKSVFDVPDANIHEIMAEQTGQALNDMTDWLTAHPQAQYVLGFGHSDQPGIEIASALETAGLLETSVAVGQGASDEALVDLRERTDETSIFKATVSYFPENYGQYLVPVIVDLIEGNPVPDEVFLGHAVIDRSNVDEYYPE